MSATSKFSRSRQAFIWRCRGLFAFTSLLLTLQSFSRAAILNGISPNGRYFITTSIKQRKIEGDWIPEVFLFLNDKKSNRRLGELCSIPQLNPIADSTRNLVLTWSKDSRRLALYLDSSHAHSFLSVYMIGREGVEKARLPSNIGYDLASATAHWQPPKSVNDIAWSTFGADDFVWLDDRDLSLHVHYAFDELGTSIIEVGRLLERDGGWTFKAEKVQLE